MMMASPTAASPAATVMTKIVKTCPSSDASRYEKATRLMLTALSISSIAISTVIMLRRITTPISPTANSVPDNIRYASVLGSASGIDCLLHFLLRLDAVEDELLRRLFFDRGELALSDHDRADHRHEEEQRCHFERHEVRLLQRHADRLVVRIPLPHGLRMRALRERIDLLLDVR